MIMFTRNEIIICLVVVGAAIFSGNILYFKFWHTSGSSFQPFFKGLFCFTNSNFLPPLPELTDFDRGVLEVCGDWGSRPKKSDFRALLDSSQHHDVVKDIYDRLDHQVFTPNADLNLFKDELVHVWFKKKRRKDRSSGFGHIFCGELRNIMGGMHFVGRYVEAQEKQWAGPVWNKSVCDTVEVRHPVYTFGMQYLTKKGEVKIKCPSGFMYDLHADDILVYATDAFKGSGDNRMCLYKMEKEDYYSVFVKKNNAIVTFYADLTPTCDDGSSSCECGGATR